MSEIRFTRGVPPLKSLPKAQILQCATTAIEEYGDVVLQYGPARGFPSLRRLIGDEMGAAEDRVILGQGSLQLQDLCARVLLRPGDLVYVEEPTYDRAITIFRRAGAQVVGLPLEDDGLDVEVLEKWLIKGGSPVFLYTIPDFQNPSGTVLSREKRQRVAELARKHGFWIIEDVPYRKLRYAGNESPPIFASAPERVVHMASYSKLISPGLRVGFAIAPEPLAGQLAKMAEDTYVNPSYLNQAIVYEFLRRGWLQPQLAQLKALYKPRLDALLSALDAHMSGVATWCKPEGGFFVGLTLNDGINAADLLARARAAELILTDGRGFYADGGGDRFIRLPFCALRPDEISEGIARLAQVVQTTA